MSDTIQSDIADLYAANAALRYAAAKALIGHGAPAIGALAAVLAATHTAARRSAAWALGKALIPALFQVDADQLLDPIRQYQARVIEITAQRQALVNELPGT